MGRDKAKPIVNLISSEEEIPAQLKRSGVPTGRPVIVLFGGAAGIDDDYGKRLYPVVRDGVVATADELGAVIVDGGTDSGVMALAGRARSELALQIPLVGVAPAAKVAAEGVSAATGRTPVDRHHSHHFLVPGTEWGDESPTLFAIARVIADGKPVVVVLIDGGPVALAESLEAVREGWSLVAVDASGRMADLIAAYKRGWTAPGMDADRSRIHLTNVHRGAPPLGERIRALVAEAPAAVRVRPDPKLGSAD